MLVDASAVAGGTPAASEMVSSSAAAAVAVAEAKLIMRFNLDGNGSVVVVVVWDEHVLVVDACPLVEVVVNAPTLLLARKKR
jgi:hypothetical protein